MLKRIIVWAVVIFAGFWLLTDPHGAADVIRHGLALPKHAGNALATFINSL